MPVIALLSLTRAFLEYIKTSGHFWNFHKTSRAFLDFSIVDFTVCPIQRPKRPFDEAKVFFRGKHYIYALKNEVWVNVRSGTAAFVSKAYPGCVHDIILLRDHAEELDDTLGGRSLLADLGYQCAHHDVPTIILCDSKTSPL